MGISSGASFTMKIPRFLNVGILLAAAAAAPKSASGPWRC
jgi:hypothetical protein